MVDVFLVVRDDDGYDEVIGVYFDKGNALAHARTSLAEELAEALTGVQSKWGADDFEVHEHDLGPYTHIAISSPPGAFMAAVYLDLPVFRVDHHEAAD